MPDLSNQSTPLQLWGGGHAALQRCQINCESLLVLLSLLLACLVVTVITAVVITQEAQIIAALPKFPLLVIAAMIAAISLFVIDKQKYCCC